jgi:murein DD-endopeptidase MepM/ murein hydrolase activator NlpD
MAEFEELRLTVNLADSASAGLQRIRQQIGQLGQAATATTAGLAQVTSSVVDFGAQAHAAAPKLRSANAAMGDLQRGAADTGRALGQMGLVVKQGFGAGLPQLTLGLWDAASGVSRMATAMESIAPTARVATLALGGIALGVVAVGVAVAAYGVSVFRFAKEMDQLARTARTLGMSFAELKWAQDQAKAFGQSADSVIRSFQGIQNAQFDLYKNNSQLRAKLLGQGVDANWINQLAVADPNKAREMIAKYGVALERQAIASGAGKNVAAAIRNQFYKEFGQTAEDMEHALKPIDPAAKAELERVEALSKSVSEVWGEISLKLEKMTFNTLSLGLPVLLGVLRIVDGTFTGISKVITVLNRGLEKIGFSLIGVMKMIPGLGPAVALVELLYKLGGGGGGGATPIKPSSYDGGAANDNNANPLAQRVSFRTDQLTDETGRNADETGKLTGQLEKLNAYFDRMDGGGGGAGGGGGFQNASFGGSAGAATAGRYGGGGPGRGGYSGGGGGGTGDSHDHSHPAAPGGGMPGPSGLQGQVPEGYKGLVDPMTGKLGGGLGAARAGHSHQGIDILGPVGSPIYASGAGTIIKHNPTGSFQNDAVTTIRLDDGRIVRYMHHKLDPNLQEGQRVTPGQAIGTSGQANGVAHLHYDIKRPGQPGYLDPEREHGWSRGKDGVAPQGGLTSPSGGVLAKVDASAKVSDVGSAQGGGLAADRARFKAELDADPALRAKVLRIAANEQGKHGLGTQAVLESMMNRASFKGTSLAAQAKWTGEGGYYAMGTMGRGALEDKEHREVLEGSLAKVYGGSNITDYATDNASQGLARKRTANQEMVFTKDYGGESFYQPGRVSGEGNVRKYAGWRAGLARDSLTADKANDVQTDGKLTADVRAPSGTKVEVSGSGAFKNTETSRETTMSRETANQLLAVR